MRAVHIIGCFLNRIHLSELIVADVVPCYWHNDWLSYLYLLILIDGAEGRCFLLNYRLLLRFFHIYHLERLQDWLNSSILDLIIITAPREKTNGVSASYVCIGPFSHHLNRTTALNQLLILKMSLSFLKMYWL